MQTKAFEVRDRSTYIPVIATAMIPDWRVTDQGIAERSLLRSQGYDVDAIPARGAIMVYMARMDGSEGHLYPHDWSFPGTLPVAHRYICDHWALLGSGDVIDCEFIRGETARPKRPQRLERVEA